MPVDNDSLYDLEPDSCLAYIALQVLASRQDSLVPELLYLLKPEQIISFIKMFSGETLKIPTADEFSRDLSAALAIYHVVIQGKSLDWFALKYEFDNNYMRGIKTRLGAWSQSLTESEKQFIGKLTMQEEARVETKKETRRLMRTMEDGRQFRP